MKSTYARWAPVYDRTFGAATVKGRHKAVGYINAQPIDTALEVGVGTGLALPHYRADLAVTGIDYSEDMLEKARARVQKAQLRNVRALHQMDARDLDFPDASFDLVAAMHIVSVVPEPERVMSEIARVCKPGGKVVITNHFAREAGLLSMLERLSAPLENLLGWHSDFDMQRILGEADLEVIEQSSLPPFRMMTFLVLQKKSG